MTFHTVVVHRRDNIPAGWVSIRSLTPFIGDRGADHLHVLCGTGRVNHVDYRARLEQSRGTVYFDPKSFIDLGRYTHVPAMVEAAIAGKVFDVPKLRPRRVEHEATVVAQPVEDPAVAAVPHDDRLLQMLQEQNAMLAKQNEHLCRLLSDIAQNTADMVKTWQAQDAAAAAR